MLFGLIPEGDDDFAPPDPQMEARANGYSWGEIWDHIAKASVDALGFGYTQPEIDKHLGYNDPEAMRLRARTQWATQAAADPKSLERATAPEPELNLTTSPTLVSDYAEALKNREAKGPRDFADAYAGGAMEALHDVHGVEGDEADINRRQIAAAQAANSIVPFLPRNEDFTDATIALTPPPNFDITNAPGMVQPANIDPWNRPALHNPDGYSTADTITIGTNAGEAVIPTVINGIRLSNDEAINHFSKTGETFGIFDDPKKAENYAEGLHEAMATLYDRNGNRRTVRDNLIDNWRDTGQHPFEAAIQAQSDPDVWDKLLAPSPPGALGNAVDAIFKNAGTIADFYKEGALGIGRAVVGTVINLEHIGEASLKAISNMTGSEGLHDYVVEHAKVWQAREDRWNAALKGTNFAEAGTNPIGFIGGVMGEAVPTIAEYVAAGIPAMIVYGVMHGADAAFRDTGNWAASAAGALIGGASAGAPVPFLRGAVGKGLVDNAVRGAVGMGLVGGIQSVTDGMPRAIANRDWSEISFAGVPEGVVRGAIGGALFGTFGGIRQMQARVIDSSKPPGEGTADMPLAEALKEVEPAAFEPQAEGDTGPPKFVATASPAAKLARIAELELENHGVTPNIMEIGTFFQRRLAAMGETDPATIELAKGYETAGGVLHFVKSLMGDLLTNTEGSMPREPRGFPPAQPEWVAPSPLPPTPHEQTQAGREAAALRGPSEPLPPNTTPPFPPAQKVYRAPKPEPPTAAELERAAQEKKTIAAQRGRQDIGRNYQKEPAKPFPLNDYNTREAVRDTLIKEGSLGEQEYIHFAGLIDGIRHLLNPHMPEWLEGLKNGSAMDTTIGRALQLAEGKTFTFDENGKRVALRMAKDDPLKSAFDVFAHINEAIWEMAQARVAAGKLDPIGYVKDYWSHQWEDPNAAMEAWFGAGGGQGRSSNLTQQRVLPTTADGLALGLKLKIPDIGDHVLNDISGKIKFLHHLDAQDRFENQMGILVRSVGDRLPFPGAVRIEGRSSQRMTSEGMEYAWMPADAAKLYNNAISRGWYAYPQTGTTFQKLMWLKNSSVSTKMIVPLFHSFVIVEQTLTTGIQMAMSELLAGNFGQAAVEVAKTVSGKKAQEIASAGVKAMSDYANMTGDPYVQLAVESGARFGKRQLPYQTGQRDIVTSILQNKGHVLEAAGREIAREVKSLGGEEGEALWQRGAMFVPRVAGVGLHEISRLTTTTSAPLFDIAIPVMKAGATALRIKQYMDLNSTADPAAVKTRVRQIVENIDDRFGEMNQDNLMWNKWVKQTANMASISTSWAYGTWRWLAAASGYNLERGVEWNPEATSSLIGALVVYAGANAIMTMINTGERPHDVWDFLNFRTGGTTKTGAEQRGLLPTEFKELYDMGKIAFNAVVDPMSIPKGLAHYIAGKENPVFQTFTALLTGEDAIGHKISQTPRGWTGYFVDQVTPIIFNNLSGEPPGTGLNKVERTFIREAPPWMEDPQAYYAQQIKLTDRWKKEELARARKEALAQGLEPPPGSKPPGRPSGGGIRARYAGAEFFAQEQERRLLHARARQYGYAR